jgi:hypothetical protein
VDAATHFGSCFTVFLRVRMPMRFHASPALPLRAEFLLSFLRWSRSLLFAESAVMIAASGLGGTAPLVAVALNEAFGSSLAFSSYIVLASLVTIMIMLTAGRRWVADSAPPTAWHPPCPETSSSAADRAAFTYDDAGRRHRPLRLTGGRQLPELGMWSSRNFLLR